MARRSRPAPKGLPRPVPPRPAASHQGPELPHLRSWGIYSTRQRTSLLALPEKGVGDAGAGWGPRGWSQGAREKNRGSK